MRRCRPRRGGGRRACATYRGSGSTGSAAGTRPGNTMRRVPGPSTPVDTSQPRTRRPSRGLRCRAAVRRAHGHELGTCAMTSSCLLPGEADEVDRVARHDGRRKRRVLLRGASWRPRASFGRARSRSYGSPALGDVAVEHPTRFPTRSSGVRPRPSGVTVVAEIPSSASSYGSFVTERAAAATPVRVAAVHRVRAGRERVARAAAARRVARVLAVDGTLLVIVSTDCVCTALR